jgi:hypothetical protein
LDLLGQGITPGARFQGELRRNVQMVFQDPYASLHPNHTLWHPGGAAEDPRIGELAAGDHRLSKVWPPTPRASLSASALRRSAPARGHCPRAAAAPADPAAG